VPPPVVTLTVLAVLAAKFVITKFAVIWVLLTTFRFETVIPVPDTLIVEIGVKFVPVSVTGTVVL
jgi:hypothetical protein